MGIISTGNIALSSEEALAQTIKSIKNSSTQLFNQMVQNYNSNVNRVWNNQYGLTPQQVLTGFGPDASGLFGLANKLADTINYAIPNTITIGSLPVTFNQDGTVTVNM